MISGIGCSCRTVGKKVLLELIDDPIWKRCQNGLGQDS